MVRSNELYVPSRGLYSKVFSNETSTRQFMRECNITLLRKVIRFWRDESAEEISKRTRGGGYRT